MTDREQLCRYRVEQADEALAAAQTLLTAGNSARAVANRAYYAAFYMVLALFNSEGTRVKTAKHRGIISLFDVEFVHTGKINKLASEKLHELFDTRLELDYKEMSFISAEDAAKKLERAKEFVEELTQYIERTKS